MRVFTKKIRVIEMTEEEMRKFHELMERARVGSQVNYAEDRLQDGSFLGVSVVQPQEERTRAQAY